MSSAAKNTGMKASTSTSTSRWCQCDAAEASSRGPDTVKAHDLTCRYVDDPKKYACKCWVPPVLAQGPLTVFDHDDECRFPESRCHNDRHRLYLHRACGKPMRMRFCGCSGSDYGFTFDVDREWWVHYVCGWPTQAWYEGCGQAVAKRLEGVKPITYHEYRVIPKVPKWLYEKLTPEQKVRNAAAVGTWVRD